MTIRLAVTRFLIPALLFFVLLSPKSSFADVRMPVIFGNHMVLQQDTKIPVWGWADAGEAVTVRLGDQIARTRAGADGKWRVDLDPVANATAPFTLTVKGKNRLRFNDVLVGDVWVCSGQSNMEFTMKREPNSATEIAQASDPQLRLFVVARKIALEPQTDLNGEWKVCSPDSVAPFSAVGYYFGRQLRRTLHRPIGLIGTYWGAMPAQAFVSLSGLQKDPPFANYIADYQKVVADYPKAKEDYPADLAAFQDQLKQWNATVAPTYNVTLKQWQDAFAQAEARGQFAPPKPQPSVPMPQAPNLPEGAPSTPTVLYNGMIAPLIPYAIKGVIWYQGEANTDEGIEYQNLFPRLITDWREKWNQGDFPFLYVQLAGFTAPQTKPSEGGWAYLREAQLKALALPNTGMAVAIDIGDENNIHPADKLDVGLRLALVARHVAYQENLVYSGPIYDSMKIEGNKIRLIFQDTGAGLQVGTPPWTPNSVPVPAPTELTGFAIAGTDRNWVWAKAQIDGNTVVVSSDQVEAPVAVRYGWANNPPCNLYNREGLPASPFRTDHWPEPVPAPVPTPPSAPPLALIPSSILFITVCCAWISVAGYLVWGFEDLVFDLFGLKHRWQQKGKTAPTLEQLKAKKEQLIAIFVPAWQEAGIVNRMAEYAINTLDYHAYDIFIGVYPNDIETCRQVDAITERFARIHRVTNAHAGPTSKADCLNAIYHGMKAREARDALHYSIVAIHDAEDVLHDQTLRMYNYHVPEQVEMAQLPVFPLEEKPWLGWVRNTYIDEFCESHLKDMTIRQAMGGVVPSAGVGTAFDRKSLDELARKNGGDPFQADSLTEDYMAGLEFSRMNKRITFLNQPLTPLENAAPLKARPCLVSVREYFPASLTASIRQRGRWILGIAFQSWQLCGWFGSFAQRYSLYRDRRSPLVHAINPIGYVMLLYVLARGAAIGAGWATPDSFPSPFIGQPHLWMLTMVAMALLLYRFAMKSFCVYRIYGRSQALFCVLRFPVANVINFCATVRAVHLYIDHKRTGRPLAWNKTSHQFPTDSTLQEQVGTHRLD